MKVQVLLFGSLREKFGFSKKEMEFADTDSLEIWIKTEHPELVKLPYNLAVNQDLIRLNVLLNEGDEIAVMPPFAGG